MIVVDEHLQRDAIRDSIARWYPGAIVNLTDPRPATLIKDEAVPPCYVPSTSMASGEKWIQATTIASFVSTPPMSAPSLNRFGRHMAWSSFNLVQIGSVR
jgi:hypothetical protein